MMKITHLLRHALITITLTAVVGCAQPVAKIDRQALVSRHNPALNKIDWHSPFTLGNGQFAFTADVTGLQSLADDYYAKGTPLETKARWAWHSHPNPNHYKLKDTYVSYQAYSTEVDFPTNMDGDAGQWLRQNPHDLPLSRISLLYNNQPLTADKIGKIQQSLDLWQGELTSQYQIDGEPVELRSSVAQSTDSLGFNIHSALIDKAQLAVKFAFPRGYDLQVKNTPDLIWNAEAHHTSVVSQDAHSVVFKREVDDHQHWLKISWQGDASLNQLAPQQYVLTPAKGNNNLGVTVQFSQQPDGFNQYDYAQITADARQGWQNFWQSGAAIDFSGSRSAQAKELERRVILSQYLMAAQERADIPAQETGLTSSSWYGKFHTEMSWWHSAHWSLWQRGQYTQKVLDWYVAHLPVAQQTAKDRGLSGARWSKMVGPDGRESPGGNPLIIWNQPQPIDLAERLYQSTGDKKLLQRYAELVMQTADALSSMLVYQPQLNRYSLLPPIWIAQEHYDVTQSQNPSFELAYWRTALITAQKWRSRLGLQANPQWQQQIEKLAALPQKDGKYVAIETIPDTFDNIESRNDHPAMLALWGLLEDQRTDKQVMQNTLDAVLRDWDFATRIWGWDYPMIAMTATKLNRPQQAVDALLMDAHNNHYMVNGNCPQQKVGLPVYLPANGALLSAVAMMAMQQPESSTRGFPADGSWQVKTEGFTHANTQ
ncbi:hypothetical protein [Neptunicella marina]|uniref:Glycosyl hydrolase family 65, N-terminal domain n=1 Tax=Neptunicella marina TaxID=2125989 RepID=A0A8J6LX87_9ALTE|nr:hypothetical protein [Neptunicella marina]MBC3765489.1 hypothetical protein [Neptunicella marina]